MGGTSTAVAIQQAIFKKDAQRLEKILKQFMLESVSFYDGAKEDFYHGLTLGLLAAVISDYLVKSNHESGYGRFDVALFPKNRALPGFIFEFKKALSESDLQKKAEEALKQIETNEYDSLLRENGNTNIVKIVIAFFGKQAKVQSL